MQQVSWTQLLGIKKPGLINSQVAQLLDPTPINFRTVQLVTDRPTDPPWEGFCRQTCINHLRRNPGCKLIDQIYTTILLNQPWEEIVPWERTPWHWSKHFQFRPIMTVPPKAVFLCTADKLQCWHMLAHAGTCWHVRAHIGAWCHSTFSTCHSLGQKLQWFYKVLDIKFFHLKVARGLALGESCCCLRKCLSLPYFAGRLSRRFTWFWHLMTDEITNQTLEVLTDARMLADWTQHTGLCPPFNQHSFEQ